jgi:D-3-phosphoglycerate dehydrogenase / 2-oxoglutarate reductase
MAMVEAVGNLRVLVTGASLAPAAIAELERIGARVDMMPGAITEDSLIAELAAQPTAAVLMRANPPFSRRVIESAPHLKILAKAGVGVDAVDLQAASDNGVLVTTSGDANADAVAEHTMALMLALRRDVVWLSERVHAGQWDRGHYLGRELGGSTLGIVGFGNTGRRVARLALAFGMRVIVLARASLAIPADLAAVEPVSREQLLAQSDVISLHCPLTPDTRHFVGVESLKLMKPGVLIINTSRGALVDEAALAQAIRGGQAGGFAADTVSAEPVRADNPLLGLKNVILTPHIAGETPQTVERILVRAAQCITEFAGGKPVDPAIVANKGWLDRAPASR